MSCVATQLSSILYPAPDEAAKNEAIAELMEALVPVVEHTRRSSELANVELIKLIFNDLHPIIRNTVITRDKTAAVQEEVRAGSEHDDQVNDIIKNLKEKNVRYFL